MLKSFIISLMLCTATPLIITQANAASGVGRITQAYGPSWVINGTKRIKAEKGMTVFRNDSIITGARARVKVIMSDGSKMYVGTKSRVSLKEYSLEGKQLISATIHMLWGKARFFVNKLVSRNSSFRVHTPTAVLGVRGTEFIISVPPGSSMLESPFARMLLASMPPLPTRVTLIEGSVNVSTSTGSSVLLTPGNTADADESGEVKTHKTESNDIDKHGSDLGFKHDDNVGGNPDDNDKNEAPKPPALGAQKSTEGGSRGGQNKLTSIDTSAAKNAIQNLGSTTDVTIKAGFVKP